jgi:hypothetical protein
MQEYWPSLAYRALAWDKHNIVNAGPNQLHDISMRVYVVRLAMAAAVALHAEGCAQPGRTNQEAAES